MALTERVLLREKNTLIDLVVIANPHSVVARKRRVLATYLRLTSTTARRGVAQ
jgi:hypothetical protein